MEQSFSQMKMIKTRLRNRLRDSNVLYLMKIAIQYLSNLMMNLRKWMTFGERKKEEHRFKFCLLHACFLSVFVILFSVYIVLPCIKIMGPFSGVISIPAGAIPISVGANYPRCPHLKKPCVYTYKHTYNMDVHEAR